MRKGLIFEIDILEVVRMINLENIKQPEIRGKLICLVSSLTPSSRNPDFSSARTKRGVCWSSLCQLLA